MLSESATLEHIKTGTEHEALLLEAELVQQYQPKYNVLLKSGQPFVFLMVEDRAALLPIFSIVRSREKKGLYFGPFIHKQQARNVYDFLMSTFRLFLFNKKIENGCLDYHLGKCAGMCRSDFDQEGYLFRIELAKDALKKDHKDFLKKITEKIKEYSHKLEFEKAKNLYNYQQNIDFIFKTLETKFSLDRYQEKINQTLHPEFQIIADDYQKVGYELQQALQLKAIPRTIDCFDISHFQSHAMVGSCIRFLDGKPDKNAFRRFKIKTLKQQNDYAALQEIVSRRYRDEVDLPDVVLIDGGKGQRNAIVSLIPTTICISLAKKEELLFADNYPEGLPLDIHSGMGKMLIALRDYAHHFAITFHRYVRSKSRS